MEQLTIEKSIKIEVPIFPQQSDINTSEKKESIAASNSRFTYQPIRKEQKEEQPSLQTAKIFFEAAKSDHEQKELNKALTNYKETIEVLLKIYEKNSNTSINRKTSEMIIESLQKGCEILILLGDYSEAFIYFQKTFPLLEKIKVGNFAKIADCFDAYSDILCRFGCFSNALEQLEKAIKIRKENNIKTTPVEWKKILERKGDILIEIYDFQGALATYEEIVKLVQETSQKHLVPILCKKADALIRCNQLNDALKVNEEILRILKKIHKSNRNHPSIVITWMEIGRILEKQNRPSEAKKAYENAYEMAAAQRPNKETDPLFALQQLGDLAMKIDLPDCAIAFHTELFGLLIKAGKEMDASGSEEEIYLHIRMYVCLNGMLNDSIKLQAPDKIIFSSVSQLLDTIDILMIGIRAFPQYYHQLKVLESSLDFFETDAFNIQMPLFYPQNLKDAKTFANEEGFKVIKNLLLKDEIKDQKREIKAARACKKIGEMLLRMGSIKYAEEYFQVALKVFEKNYSNKPMGFIDYVKQYAPLGLKDDSEEDEDIFKFIECLENLAAVYGYLGEFSKALKYIQRAENCIQQIKEKKKQPEEKKLDCYALAMVLDQKGLILLEMGKFHEAEEAFEAGMANMMQVYAIRLISDSKTCKNISMRIASFLDHLGVVRKELGRLEEALACHKESLNFGGPNSITLILLTNILIDLDQRDEAKKHAAMAWDLTLRALTVPFFSLKFEAVECMNHIVFSMSSLGKAHEALKALNLIYQDKELRAENENSIDTTLISVIAMFQQRIGEYDNALNNYRKAYQIQKKLFGDNHPEIANSLSGIAECLIKLDKDPEQAGGILQQALKIRETFFGDQHPLTSTSLDKLAFYFSYVKKDPEEAKKLYAKAYEIRKKVYPPGHSLIKLSESYLETFEYSSSGDKQTGLLLNKEEFEKLVIHAETYLEDQTKELILEKNPSGFVRLRLPCPDHLADKVETVRLHYWPPELHIDRLETLHNHPQYFESMILKGGYTHLMYKQANEFTVKAEPHITYRVLKISKELRSIYPVDVTRLEFDRVQDVTKGTIIGFPREMVHQVSKSIKGTLSINCVFKHKANRTFYEVFIPKNSSEDPQLERETLIPDESNKILTEVRKILKTWKSNPV